MERQVIVRDTEVSLEAGQRSLIKVEHGRRLELPLRDDDDDPLPGKCLVAYKLLLVVQ